jgi:hypothetical protein
MGYKQKATIAFIVLFLFFGAGSVYASSALPAGSASPGDLWKNIKVSMIVSLSAKDFSRVTGQKLNIIQRMAFTMTKKKMKQALKKNQELTAGEFFAEIRTLEKIWLITLAGLALVILLVILLLARI